MEFKIEAAAFLQGLYFAQGIADRKATMPGFWPTSFCGPRGPDKILVAATDLNLTVTTGSRAGISEGGLTIAAKHLHDIVKSLPGDRVAIPPRRQQRAESAPARSTTRSSACRPRLPQAAELPRPQVPPRWTPALRDLIAKTFFQSPPMGPAAHLNGVLFECEGSGDKATARMVSTDGHRLSKCERAPGR